ncbi:MAG: two-component system, CitB family, response regulator DctR [Moorella sp. (in: firmicutes)]|jgi:response regulator of citrate/malate metabolism|uniref:response regulator n=1 Tax=unclassified Neomoorella TaxID=2676739 RepID=UPI0010FFC730|nr:MULTISPECIES: response regulator [unclassified Moorella (in: firmicutes)]MDK2815385.1 two-component system, CitB family, response regulator DctR [Moorella sp. (in: firmicutes)]MDK2894555.1 two-component system, CitB family, response regulator DctR [Moorella sp. (in: firmicutes)]GEA15345.1 response regulator [Moorella sp. E308F]GEA19794.1 response regulator [Moorella sp. E306M]
MTAVGVFIVEDDPMVLEIHRRFIESVPGFQVVGAAQDGQSALEGVQNTGAQLVILDIFMPEIDGLTLLRQLRQLTVPVDVIVVTAAQEASTVQEALWLGAVDYLIKPFRFERLRQALERYRNRCRQLMQLKTNELKQEDLDRILETRPEANRPDLPKGLQDKTLDLVIQVLKSRSPSSLSAREVAEMAGLSRITARRYLEYLLGLGLVIAEPEYGSVGRPLNRYRWNEGSGENRQ